MPTTDCRIPRRAGGVRFAARGRHFSPPPVLLRDSRRLAQGYTRDQRRSRANEILQPIHGGKTKNDRLDSFKIATLLRGGLLPQAYVYPAAMRPTRDLLRRRLHLVRKRAAPRPHPKHPRHHPVRSGARVRVVCAPGELCATFRRVRPTAAAGPRWARRCRFSPQDRAGGVLPARARDALLDGEVPGGVAEKRAGGSDV
jgi:hypothetical protein